MDDKVLRIVFAFFVGALLALFVGFGIHTVYPPPEAPDTSSVELKANPSDEEIARATAERRTYEAKYQTYSRNVSIVSMGAATVMLAGSLVLERRNKVMANGILLGGLFTLIYGVGRGFVSRDTTTLFIALSAALVLVLFLGFRRFGWRTSRPETPASESRDTGRAVGG